MESFPIEASVNDYVDLGGFHGINSANKEVDVLGKLDSFVFVVKILDYFISNGFVFPFALYSVSWIFVFVVKFLILMSNSFVFPFALYWVSWVLCFGCEILDFDESLCWVSWILCFML